MTPLFTYQVCDGIVDCEISQEDEMNCEHHDRFYCTSKDDKVNIPKTEVCNGINNCLNEDDEKNCTERFMCSAQHGKRVRFINDCYF